MRPHLRLQARGCKTAVKILDPYRPPFFLKFLYAVHTESCPQGGFSYVTGVKARPCAGLFGVRAEVSCQAPPAVVLLWRLCRLYGMFPLGMGGGSRAGKLLPSARGAPGKLRLRCPPLALMPSAHGVPGRPCPRCPPLVLTPSLRDAYLISDKNI